MKLNTLINIIESKYPLSLQENWDCSGLLYNIEKEINNILIVLDITKEVVEYSINNNIDLIISHHPFLFNGYDLESDVVKRRYNKLIENRIACYSMHTNYDNHIEGMNYQFTKKLMIENKIVYNNKGLVIVVENKILEVLKKEFKNNDFRIYNKIDPKNVAILLGSGAFVINELDKNTNVLISGDFKHHDILNAIDNNIMLIDVMHQMESIFINHIIDEIKNIDQNFNVEGFDTKYRFEEL